MESSFVDKLDNSDGNNGERRNFSQNFSSLSL